MELHNSWYQNRRSWRKRKSGKACKNRLALSTCWIQYKCGKGCLHRKRKIDLSDWTNNGSHGIFDRKLISQETCYVYLQSAIDRTSRWLDIWLKEETAEHFLSILEELYRRRPFHCAFTSPETGMIWRIPIEKLLCFTPCTGYYAERKRAFNLINNTNFIQLFDYHPKRLGLVSRHRTWSNAISK